MPAASAEFNRIAPTGFDIGFFFRRGCEEKKCDRSINTRSRAFPSISMSVNESAGEIISLYLLLAMEPCRVVGYDMRSNKIPTERETAGKPVARLK